MKTQHRIWLFLRSMAVMPGLHAGAQQGGRNGEWRFYGGDAGTSKYSPLDQINASNVKDLKIVWEWKSLNFGRRADFNWEVTPLMAGGVLHFTAGTKRHAAGGGAANRGKLREDSLGGGGGGAGGRRRGKSGW